MPANLGPSGRSKTPMKAPRLGAGQIGSRYKAVKLLGRGAFGAAFLVMDGSKELAMKRVEISHMNNEQKAAAEHECVVMAQLDAHPFIIRMHTHFVEVGRLWIVMDFADDGDLATAMERQREAKVQFDEERVLDWLVQICLALRFAHEKKVLHRDVKPQNVFLMRSGSVRLGDFGISKTLGSTSALAMTTVGTPLYLAPEVCQGEEYNSRCDAWSVGVLVYELCALRVPFHGNNMPALVMQICRTEPAPLPDGSFERVKPLVSQLLRKLPAERPTVAELLASPELTARAEVQANAGALEREKSMRSSSVDSSVASAGGDSKNGDGAQQPKAQGRANGANKTSAMRETLHKGQGKPTQDAAAREAAKAEREAQREQIRRDRQAAMRRKRGDGSGGSGGSAGHGSGAISVFELVVPDKSPGRATVEASTRQAHAASPAPAGSSSGDGSKTDRGNDESDSEEAAVLRRAVAEAYPGARLLSGAERLEAAASLERRAAELRKRGEEEVPALAGQAARVLLNDLARELITIQRLQTDLAKRYVLVRPLHASAATDGGMSASGRLRGMLPEALRSQVGLIEQEDVDEEDDDDNDGADGGLHGGREDLRAPSTRWSRTRERLKYSPRHSGGAENQSQACVVS